MGAGNRARPLVHKEDIVFWILIATLLIVTLPLLVTSLVCTALGCSRRTHDSVLERVATVIAIIAVIYATVALYGILYL